jgi:hypothetical protein
MSADDGIVVEMFKAVVDELTFSVPAIPLPSREVVVEKGEKLKEQGMHQTL